jgi:hypothetical protein
MKIDFPNVNDPAIDTKILPEAILFKIGATLENQNPEVAGNLTRKNIAD